MEQLETFIEGRAAQQFPIVLGEQATINAVTQRVTQRAQNSGINDVGVAANVVGDAASINTTGVWSTSSATLGIPFTHAYLRNIKHVNEGDFAYQELIPAYGNDVPTQYRWKDRGVWGAWKTSIEYRLADSALNMANAAKNSANAATTAASTAQTAADAAKTSANNANAVAVGAQNKANTADANANSANAKVITAQNTANAALPKTGGSMSGNIKMVESGAGWGGYPPTGIVGESNDVQIQIGDWYPMITSSKFIQAGVGYSNTWQIGHFREGGGDSNGSFVVTQTGDGPLSVPLRFSIGNTGVHLRGGSGASASLNANGDVYGDAWRGLLSSWLSGRGINSMNALSNGGFTVHGNTPAVEFLVPSTVACMWYLESTGIMRLAQSDGAGAWIGSRIDVNIPKSTYLFHGQIEATGNIIAFSDRRFKDDIKKTSGLSAIAKLEGVQWVWNKDHNNAGEAGTGLIAQDVQKVLPEAITEGEDGILGLNYNGVIGLLVNAVNELTQRVKELEGAKSSDRF